MVIILPIITLTEAVVWGHSSFTTTGTVLDMDGGQLMMTSTGGGKV